MHKVHNIPVVYFNQSVVYTVREYRRTDWYASAQCLVLVNVRIRATDCISFPFIRLSSNDNNNNNQFDQCRVSRRHYILHSRWGPNTSADNVVGKQTICCNLYQYVYCNVCHLLDGEDGCLLCICISLVVIIISHRCQQIDELRTCASTPMHWRANGIRVNIHKTNSNNQHINTIIILFCGKMVFWMRSHCGVRRIGVRFHICRTNFPVSRMLAIDTINRPTDSTISPCFVWFTNAMRSKAFATGGQIRKSIISWNFRATRTHSRICLVFVFCKFIFN